MKDELKATYTYHDTKVSVDYGSMDFTFEISVGNKSFTVEATKKEVEELMKRIDFMTFDWKNIMQLETLCKTFYIIITEG
jgi:hypothetical protein